MKITVDQLRTMIRGELEEAHNGHPEEGGKNPAYEAFVALGEFLAKLINEGHSELAAELDQIVVMLQKSGASDVPRTLSEDQGGTAGMVHDLVMSALEAEGAFEDPAALADVVAGVESALKDLMKQQVAGETPVPINDPSAVQEEAPAPVQNKTIKITLGSLRDMVRQQMQEAAQDFQPGDHVNDERNGKAYKVKEARAETLASIFNLLRLTNDICTNSCLNASAITSNNPYVI